MAATAAASIALCIRTPAEAIPNLMQMPSAMRLMYGAAGLEVLTGLTLILSPSLLSYLLFGSSLKGAGEASGRICGIDGTLSVTSDLR